MHHAPNNVIAVNNASETALATFQPFFYICLNQQVKAKELRCKEMPRWEVNPTSICIQFGRRSAFHQMHELLAGSIQGPPFDFRRLGLFNQLLKLFQTPNLLHT